MKKQVTTRNLKGRTFAILFSLSMLSASAGFAQSAPQAEIKPQPGLKYLGKLGDQMYFELQYPNAEGKNFTVYIQDGTGFTLYRGRFNGRNFSKKFQIDGSQVDSDKLTFRIYEEGSKDSQDFVINNNVSVMENVVVTRL